MDLNGMQLGAVFPHNEIGTDPAAIKAFAQGVEALGISHLLIYDHVLGADPDREGGFRGPYDKDIAFHEPLTTFAFIAGVTERLEMITTILILPPSAKRCWRRSRQPKWPCSQTTDSNWASVSAGTNWSMWA